jgi:DNA-binding NtrC family response regulator
MKAPASKKKPGISRNLTTLVAVRAKHGARLPSRLPPAAPHGTPEAEGNRVAQIVAFVDDLFFQAKILETAKHVGVEVRTCSTTEALLAEIAKHSPALVVVDLNARNHPVNAIAQVRAVSKTLPLICFLSHVQVDLAAEARAAGCTEVMPRSKFTQHLATILGHAKSHS